MLAALTAAVALFLLPWCGIPELHSHIRGMGEHESFRATVDTLGSLTHQLEGLLLSLSVSSGVLLGEIGMAHHVLGR